MADPHHQMAGGKIAEPHCIKVQGRISAMSDVRTKAATSGGVRFVRFRILD